MLKKNIPPSNFQIDKFHQIINRIPTKILKDVRSTGCLSLNIIFGGKYTPLEPMGKKKNKQDEYNSYLESHKIKWEHPELLHGEQSEDLKFPAIIKEAIRLSEIINFYKNQSENITKLDENGKIIKPLVIFENDPNFPLPPKKAFINLAKVYYIVFNKFLNFELDKDYTIEPFQFAHKEHVLDELIKARFGVEWFQENIANLKLIKTADVETESKKLRDEAQHLLTWFKPINFIEWNKKKKIEESKLASLKKKEEKRKSDEERKKSAEEADRDDNNLFIEKLRSNGNIANFDNNLGPITNNEIREWYYNKKVNSKGMTAKNYINSLKLNRNKSKNKINLLKSSYIGKLNKELGNKSVYTKVPKEDGKKEKKQPLFQFPIEGNMSGPGKFAYRQNGKGSYWKKTSKKVTKKN